MGGGKRDKPVPGAVPVLDFNQTPVEGNGMAVTPRLTLDEFLQRPETKPASEYVCGEPSQKPMPDWNHARIQTFLAGLLLQVLSRSGLGTVLTEFRCIFGPSGATRAFVPDLVVIRQDRLPQGRYLYAPPDLAIEILSPDQPQAEFAAKLAFYLRHGVRLVWVIDPNQSTIAVLAPGADSRLLTAADNLDGGDVLPNFSVPVADIFAQMAR